MTNPANPFSRPPRPAGASDPSFSGSQPQGSGSLLRSIAARTPGVDYHPLSGQLGSYGRGPLGEPTFEPFHPAYVDWLVKRTRDADAANGPQPLAAADPRMSSTIQPATHADPGERSADGSFQVAQSESDAWRREIEKRLPHFQTDATPPPAPRPPTRQELFDQADRDDAEAAYNEKMADRFEYAADSKDDTDLVLKEYADRNAGMPITDFAGGVDRAAWRAYHYNAKRLREQARRARAQAERMPK